MCETEYQSINTQTCMLYSVLVAARFYGKNEKEQKQRAGR